MKQIFISIVVLFCAAQVFCQAGALDITFSHDGKVVLRIGKRGSAANSAAIQSDGKIVAAGYYYNGSYNNPDFLVVRFNADGTLDKTFSGNGAAGIGFGGVEYAYSVIIQSDGKIAVFGTSGTNAVAARLKTDGTLDSSFGTNGKVVIALNGNIHAAALQQDGKFIMAGSLSTGVNQGQFALIRLNSNGTLDNTFGTNGEVFTKFDNQSDHAECVAVQSDGKIVAGGASYNYHTDTSVFAIARYNSNGTLDAAFGSGGKVTTPVGSYHVAEGYTESIQPDGKILVAGDYSKNQINDLAFAVVRYNSNGSLDNSFSSNGKAGISFGGDNDFARAIALQANGEIIVAGATDNSSTEDAAVARLNSNGTLDNSFGNSGKVTTDFGGYDWAQSAAIQPDGKIVVAGPSVLPGQDSSLTRLVVARYLATGSSLTAMDEKNIADIKPAMFGSLSQNTPNPFSNTTTINYSIPQQFSSAKIIITDRSGNILKQINISGNNKGSINFNASTLLSGAYQYSLYVDGKLIASKQMTLIK